MTIKWLVVVHEWGGWFKKKYKPHYFPTFGEAIDFFNELPKNKKKDYPVMVEVPE
ncbi:hypothetical protein [Streptococcus uberis]|uniref:hypothetical protein n=1 Tax=Streptococcus uberis TaxID=1349 RepID=UPI00193A47CF|nr:hypothetical protein [Streptococcus uberis]